MKNQIILSLIASTLLITFTSCSTGSTYKSEFGNIQQAGSRNVNQMTNAEIHAEIKRAYLDGELTAEQARKAHIQLDVKGHLTAEQIALINRDRLAERHKYETNKEKLDIYRDVTQTGSSMLGDINNIKNTFKAIFN